MLCEELGNLPAQQRISLDIFLVHLRDRLALSFDLFFQQTERGAADFVLLVHVLHRYGEKSHGIHEHDRHGPESLCSSLHRFRGVVPDHVIFDLICRHHYRDIVAPHDQNDK